MPSRFTKQGFYTKMCNKHGVSATGNVYIDSTGKLTDAGKTQFKRATFRKGVRNDVFKKAKKKHGKRRDPNNPKVKLSKKKFAMGHKPGYEHEKHQISAAVQMKTRKEFVNEYNDTSHYQAEDPLLNSSHQYEDSTLKYYGD